jgi:hypothetical protein
LNLPSLHKQFAGKPQCLEITQCSSTAFRFDVFGNQLIDGGLILVLSANLCPDDRHRDESNQKTQMHMKFERRIADIITAPMFKGRSNASILHGSSLREG